MQPKYLIRFIPNSLLEMVPWNLRIVWYNIIGCNTFYRISLQLSLQSLAMIQLRFKSIIYGNYSKLYISQFYWYILKRGKRGLDPLEQGYCKSRSVQCYSRINQISFNIVTRSQSILLQNTYFSLTGNSFLKIVKLSE